MTQLKNQGIIKPMATQKEILAKLVADVETLQKEVAELKEKQVFSVPRTLEAPVEKLPEPPVVESFPEHPIPVDFKETVHQVLNKDFKIRLEPMKDSPAYLFTIVVPPKYTKVVGEDLRPKVITYADGVAGVRLWSEKVFGNLGEDVQKQIIDDRPFAGSPSVVS